MVWATASFDDAVKFSHKRGDHGPTGCVYEVELDDPEPDCNASPPWASASVMAPSGRVVRLIRSHPARGF